MSVTHGLPSGALSMAQISLLNMPGVNSTISIIYRAASLLKYVCFVLSPKSASALPGVEVTVGGL